MFANQSEANDMPEASDLEYYEAGPESSLDELLARRAAKAALEGEEDGLADLISLLDDAPGGLQAKAPPTRLEFVCSRCRLVKPRVQLSDASRLLCRDCA